MHIERETRMDFSPWPALHPGELVTASHRHTDQRTLITVARVLPAIAGDGPRLIDSSGRTYLHYDYAMKPSPAAFEQLLDLLNPTAIDPER